MTTIFKPLAALLLISVTTHALAAESVAKDGPIVSTRSLCHLIVKQLNLNKAEELKAWFAFDQFAVRIVDNLGLPRSDATAIERAVQPVLERSAWFLIHSTTQTSWSVASFTPGKTEDRCAVISDLEANAGMVLADMYLTGDGSTPRIADFMQYSMPVRGSILLAEAYRLASPPNLLPYDTTSPAARKIFQTFSRANVAQDYATMESLYLSLPAEDRTNKFYISLLMRALSDASESVRQQGLSMLHGIVGDDPEFSFAMMDHYIHVQDVPRALRSVDDIEARFGDDYHFDYLRMSILAASRPVSASFYRYADRILDANDAHIPTYDLLLRQLIVDDRYGDAVLVLDIYVERLGLPLELRLLKDYENGKAFLSSNEYKAWLKAYRKRS